MRVPKVSVLVPAYEQAAYVGQALESVLAQRFEEPFEVLVGVDLSRDDTAAIVRGFEKRASAVVRAICHSERVGMFGNFRSLLSEASGAYLALLEADDYWTNPDKLARQVAILDSRPEVALVAHIVELHDASGRKQGEIPRKLWSQDLSRKEFLESHCDVHTSSLCLRNLFRSKQPTWLFQPEFGVYDLPLKLSLVAQGEVAFVPERWSVFRRHPQAATQGVGDAEWDLVIAKALRAFRGEFSGELRHVLDGILGELFVRIAMSRERRSYVRWVAALRACRYGGTSALYGLFRSAYAQLPEGVQSTYRRARRRLRGAGFETSGVRRSLSLKSKQDPKGMP